MCKKIAHKSSHSWVEWRNLVKQDNDMNATQRRLLTAPELARQWNKPVSAIRRWSRLRIIPHVDAGFRTKYYDPEAVRRALLKRTIKELS
jgi:hypothetical protein